ncbi:MAG: hypothetical protein GX442_17095 [Candidatus Riflebacteria bacterium]|nr:hypothetical protein [Candidatus Riflebacteria bacterium]
MNPRPLLIVSPHLTGEILCQPPFGLDPEAFLVTRLESVQWLGFGRFAAVILHEPPADLLTKLALGLRDSPALESLWNLLHGLDGPRVRGLVPAPARPPKAWSDLGLEPILPHELATLTDSVAAPGVATPATHPRSAMTADDVRELHRTGVRVLPAGRPLTDWAREVADALGMSQGRSPSSHVLVRVAAQTRRDLQARGDRLFQAAHACPGLLFVLDPPMIPVFQDLFPALKNRLVSTTVHWASHGAFTGETSVAMLADLGCRGALLPAAAPYAAPANLGKLASLAAAQGLLIFTTLPLERLPGCDIMAPRPGSPPAPTVFVPLATTGDRGPADGPRSPQATWTDDQELDRLVQGKGR